MTAFKSELITGAPLRRVVIELPESRARALSRAINSIVWWNEARPEDTSDDLADLHSALGEDFGDETP